MCGIVGAIPRLTQMVEGSCQVIPEGSAAAKFQFRVASPGICIFLKWSEREMRMRNGSSSALFRAYPEGLERLRTRLRFHVNSAEGKYVRGDEPKRSLEKKRIREGPVHEDPKRTVLAPWLLGV